jgi:hypothetical protein
MKENDQNMWRKSHGLHRYWAFPIRTDNTKNSSEGFEK